MRCLISNLENNFKTIKVISNSNDFTMFVEFRCELVAV